ncbi:MAG: hypothetical protein LQ342_005146 [Letrouitia transgressa]|nr:MAG: hypothetical protein LQ342_005146 [Letrouitia transgressa]
MVAPPFYVKAVYEYSSPHDDDLSFSHGQIITVTEADDVDWYYGEYTDSSGVIQEGIFPRNFVKMYEPETPPRPSRLSRSKKELEMPAGTDRTGGASLTEPSETSAEVTEEKSTKPVEASPAVPPAVTANEAPTSVSTKPTTSSTPETVGKATTGSFRDRINAFNKPAAPPVAPAKPSGLGVSGGTGFVKKPFVAPPPSKNAYIPPLPREPPPKVYRREEDLVAEDQGGDNSEAPNQAPLPTSTQEEEDRPKPTSLKDRIALLQRQQMEQAARHTEAAQKKEKPKRPSKKRTASSERSAGLGGGPEGEPLERLTSEEYHHPESQSRSFGRSSESAEVTPIASPTDTSRQFFNDNNEAGSSNATITEDPDKLLTSKDGIDEQSRAKDSAPPDQHAEAHGQASNVKHDEDEVEEDEPEEVDPEVRRRMEIRERMAKMSGGMGMAGMFGPPGGMPPIPAKRQASTISEKRKSGNERSGTGDSATSQISTMPMMPMPGLTKVRSPEEQNQESQITKDEEADDQRADLEGPSPTGFPEDKKDERITSPRRSTDRGPPPPVPQERSTATATLPGQARGPPPPIPTERPVPLPPASSQSKPPPPPPPPPSQLMSPSEGSESDDEMSLHTKNLSLQAPTSDSSRPVSRNGAPQIPSSGPLSDSLRRLPPRPEGPQSHDLNYAQSSTVGSQEASPTSPNPAEIQPRRVARVPPVPNSSTVSSQSSHGRAPPPPPPTSAPPSRVATGDSRIPPPIPRDRAMRDSDEEVTEYDGDYDTDMAPSATHKEALKSHAKVSPRTSDLGHDSAEEEYPGPGLSSFGSAPSNLPPRPPDYLAKSQQKPPDIPRIPPPLPPSKDQDIGSSTSEHIPYNYPLPSQPKGRRLESTDVAEPMPSQLENTDQGYSASTPQRNVPPSPALSSAQYTPGHPLTTTGRTGPRQSLDVQPNNGSARRSMEASRASSEQGYIAGDIDLGKNSLWWMQQDMPPPALQDRRDVIYEIEESSATRRGGRQVVTKTVYILFMDYSQTIVTAHFDPREPSEASLEQNHEPPPPRLRQDQLEAASTRFGAHIIEGANSKKETIVGDGTPNALVSDLMTSLPDVLKPVGVRAYGALVYSNLANASVQQFDEIRSGDIITFRNTKFQGHRGTMHSKYSAEVGKPDHVAIVVDWDGTKKKIRAWEQGRESKKVKMESFKLSDMRSGEVKVWRAMARQWVGWE